MKDYQLFKFSEVFTAKRGTRLIDEDIVQGTIPYISSTKENNGIRSFVSPPEDMIIYENSITLSNSGSVGYLFYHDYQFVASDHVTVINIKNEDIKLTRNVALFLKPIFEAMRYKYNFGREISNKRIDNEYIYLPRDDDLKPDWKYMDEYISTLYNKVTFPSIQKYSDKNTLELNIDDWTEFELGRLFELEKCKCSKAGDLIDGDDVWYLGAKKKDNCVIKRVASESNLLTKGKCMVFICDGDGSVGYSNYIPFDEFIGTTNLTAGYNKHLNRKVGLFLTTVFDLQRAKYSFGRKYASRVKATTVRLPSKDGINPDYEFMEKYIDSLPYSECL